MYIFNQSEIAKCMPSVGIRGRHSLQAQSDKLSSAMLPFSYVDNNVYLGPMLRSTIPRCVFERVGFPFVSYAKLDCPTSQTRFHRLGLA